MELQTIITVSIVVVILISIFFVFKNTVSTEVGPPELEEDNEMIQDLNILQKEVEDIKTMVTEQINKNE